MKYTPCFSLHRSEALWCILVVVFVYQVHAGSKPSQACDFCRKERTPPSGKFPAEYDNCDDYLGSPQCPIINGNQNNYDVLLAPYVTNVNGGCHVNPYAVGCPKKETKKGTTKYYSCKNQRNALLVNIGIPVIIVVLLIGVLMPLLFYFSAQRTRVSSTMYMINETVDPNQIP